MHKPGINSVMGNSRDNKFEVSEEQQEKIVREIESEIECPRCYDVMTLCSDFDSLHYVCDSCDFVLYTIKKNLPRDHAISS